MISRLNIITVLQQAIVKLNAFATPRLEAELLLSHVINKPRSFLRAFAETYLTVTQLRQFVALLTRRVNGEPIAYILQEKEFFSLRLQVNPAVLIPRNESELLVEQTLSMLPAAKKLLICDLGTGSGAIALALAHQRPQWQLMAIDNSKQALAVAQQNARRLGLANVDFYYGDWLRTVGKQKFAAIISNPPYIDANDPELEKNVIAYEPQSALLAADHGLAAIKTIARQAKTHLLPRGWLLLEHGYRQSRTVAAFLSGLSYKKVSTCNDLNGLPRVTVAQYLV